MKIKIFSGPSLESLESQINLFAESNDVMDVKILPVNKGPESYLATVTTINAVVTYKINVKENKPTDEAKK